jgi:hypothetical protein
MNQAKAAGPKTELVGVSSRIQQSIEDMIASFSQGVADCMENARTAVPRSSADDCRSSERRDAVQLVSSTAELLSSIAKLKGEFSHNYHIVRDASAEERALREEKKREVALMRTQREVDEMSDEEYVDYHRAMKGLPLKYTRSKTFGGSSVTALGDGELAALEAEIESAETPAPPPPPGNHGSNTDAGES